MYNGAGQAAVNRRNGYGNNTSSLYVYLALPTATFVYTKRALEPVVAVRLPGSVQFSFDSWRCTSDLRARARNVVGNSKRRRRQ